ncbi:Asp/Glu racemase [Soonwooa sp.]|uniref:maleate cis-trans isomerase family protein n=1 Tax=Soonwooa sp. TaxID=1938592 RepID=UPI0026140308|nr:Asp/Glu racemase [Soonwooa sp.]
MSKKLNYRIGQIVPSSNVTMETEIPAMFRGRESIFPERFTFHSARMRMKHVTKEELAKMDANSDVCALELSDAHVDVMGYACLVAIMSMGKGYHCVSQERLHQKTVENDYPTPVVTSAGALVEGLRTLGVKNIAVVAPYMKPLTQMVVEYIEDQGFTVKDWIALEVSDNLEVAALDPENLKTIYKKLNLEGVEAIVLSACVQMPSLPAVQFVEDEAGMPVVTAAICTTYRMLKELGLEAKVPNAGTLLSGKY